MKKNKLSIYFIFISILSFLTIFSAIIQKSYFNLVNPVKEVATNKLLTPIDPNINFEIFDSIKARPENIDNGSINFYFENTASSSSSSSKNKQ